jgi:uncharacterized membrane protein (DUF485 family)
MNDAPNNDAERKRAIRRNVIVLTLVALAFYVGFIVMTVMKN